MLRGVTHGNGAQISKWMKISLGLLGLGTILNAVLFSILMWNRIDWGFSQLYQEIAFRNFWAGIYVLCTGTCLNILNSGFGICISLKNSIRLLTTNIVFHGFTILLFIVGSVSMLNDALFISKKWIHDMVLDLMNPQQYTNSLAKYYFLSNMHRIAQCCGATSYRDYVDIFSISPPNSCINKRKLGGKYFEQGCDVGLLLWIKEWTGGTVASIVILIFLQILTMYSLFKLMRGIRNKDPVKSSTKEDKVVWIQGVAHTFTEDGEILPRPPIRSSSIRNLSHPSSLIELKKTCRSIYDEPSLEKSSPNLPPSQISEKASLLEINSKKKLNSLQQRPFSSIEPSNSSNSSFENQTQLSTFKVRKKMTRPKPVYEQLREKQSTNSSSLHSSSICPEKKTSILKMTFFTPSNQRKLNENQQRSQERKSHLETFI